MKGLQRNAVGRGLHPSQVHLPRAEQAGQHHSVTPEVPTAHRSSFPGSQLLCAALPETHMHPGARGGARRAWGCVSPGQLPGCEGQRGRAREGSQLPARCASLPCLEFRARANSLLSLRPIHLSSLLKAKHAAIKEMR